MSEQLAQTKTAVSPLEVTEISLRAVHEGGVPAVAIPGSARLYDIPGRCFVSVASEVNLGTRMVGHRLTSKVLRRAPYSGLAPEIPDLDDVGVLDFHSSEEVESEWACNVLFRADVLDGGDVDFGSVVIPRRPSWWLESRVVDLPIGSEHALSAELITFADLNGSPIEIPPGALQIYQQQCSALNAFDTAKAAASALHFRDDTLDDRTLDLIRQLLFHREAVVLTSYQLLQANSDEGRIRLLCPVAAASAVHLHLRLVTTRELEIIAAAAASLAQMLTEPTEEGRAAVGAPAWQSREESMLENISERNIILGPRTSSIDTSASELLATLMRTLLDAQPNR